MGEKERGAGGSLGEEGEGRREGGKGEEGDNHLIYKLSLVGLSLRGSLSPFLSNFSNLQTLDHSYNQISGPIPTELQSLVNLPVLNLCANSFSGPIPPQLALCTYLQGLPLSFPLKLLQPPDPRPLLQPSYNQISGPIPTELQSLVNLAVLNLSANSLSGPIPPQLALCTYLQGRSQDFVEGRAKPSAGRAKPSAGRAKMSEGRAKRNDGSGQTKKF
ncbi:NSP-INTERACTING KINASE 2 protein [Nymphaea thermarum]|nr:NSP-INTERACTING KINASE 2 protein [Nymphaea thermarum]